MKGINVFKILLLILIPVFTASFLFWYYQKPKVLNIYILDKTVSDNSRSEHKSFNWLLNYKRYVTKDRASYKFDKDYYGFFPEIKSSTQKQFKIKTLRLFEVLSITDDLDMLYYTDTYGVSYQDWYSHVPDKLHSPLIYGGLNQNDYLLLSEMKRKNKLIVTEFNMLGSPTSELIRAKTEELFDFKWTGWTGCYFRSLNISNAELPDWVVQRYENQYKKKWEFNSAGIILVHEEGSVVVLSETSDLTAVYPQIITGKSGQQKYHIPEKQNFSCWFDIILPGTVNKVISNFHLNVNKSGKALLDSAKIPVDFPAIIEHLDNYKFYYFSGNFAERDMIMKTSNFMGFPAFAKIFNWKSSASREAFFWNFYLPLMNSVLEINDKIDKPMIAN